MDIVGSLEPSEGMRYLLTVICRTSRWMESIALPACTAIEVSNGFIRGWVQRYGIPRKIVTDNANYFQSDIFQNQYFLPAIWLGWAAGTHV